MARAKSKAKGKAKAGYLSKKHRAIIRRGKDKKSRSFTPEAQDLGAMMRKQIQNNQRLEMQQMGNNSAGEKQFTNMMRKHQNKVQRNGTGIFNTVKNTSSKAHGMKKGKIKGSKKQSRKRSKKGRK